MILIMIEMIQQKNEKIFSFYILMGSEVPFYYFIFIFYYFIFFFFFFFLLKFPLWVRVYLIKPVDQGRLFGRTHNWVTLNESTASHTYNFWLSNLSSLPEGSTLDAIPTTQLGDCLFKPSGPTLRMSILLVITGTALRYISQSRTVPDATYIPLGLIYPRG